MIYGFISSLDDETTKVFFRSKKIRGNNIYNAGSLGELTSVLQSGDVVYTVSCNRFASVRQVYTVARFCHEGDYSRLASYKGEAAVEGWGKGGAIQYELSLTVEQLERLGLLREIN